MRHVQRPKVVPRTRRKTRVRSVRSLPLARFESSIWAILLGRRNLNSFAPSISWDLWMFSSSRITAGCRATAPRCLLPFRRALPSWTTVRTRVVHPHRGTPSRIHPNSRIFGSFIFQAKAVRRTIPLTLYRQPCGTGCGKLSETLGLGGRKLEVYNSRTQTIQTLRPPALDAKVTTARELFRSAPSKNPYPAMPISQKRGGCPKGPEERVRALGRYSPLQSVR